MPVTDFPSGVSDFSPTFLVGGDSNTSGLAQASVGATGLSVLGAVSQAAGQVALGLGSAATQSSTAFAQTANNLSDLASATTARTNLGLGTAAVAASTAFTPAASTLSISTGTTLTSASNNVTYNATSSPSITVNTGLGAGFGCAFYGAVSFSGTATLVDKRVTGVGAAICCLLSFALDSYVIVGSSS